VASGLAAGHSVHGNVPLLILPLLTCTLSGMVVGGTLRAFTTYSKKIPPRDLKFRMFTARALFVKFYRYLFSYALETLVALGLSVGEGPGRGTFLPSLHKSETFDLVPGDPCW